MLSLRGAELSTDVSCKGVRCVSSAGGCGFGAVGSRRLPSPKSQPLCLHPTPVLVANEGQAQNVGPHLVPARALLPGCAARPRVEPWGRSVPTSVPLAGNRETSSEVRVGSN